MKVRKADLIKSGILERYWPKTFSDYKTSKKIRIKMRKYASDEGIENALKTGLSLFFYGTNNSGKTLMANVIAKEFFKRKKSVLVTNLKEMTDTFAKTWRDDLEAMQRFTLMKDVNLLVIDDIGKELKNEAVENVFDSVLRYRVSRLKPTIITSNIEVARVETTYGESVRALLDRAFKIIGFPDNPKFAEKMKEENRRSL